MCSESAFCHPKVNESAVSVLTSPPFYLFLAIHEMDLKKAAFHYEDQISFVSPTNSKYFC